MGLCDVYNYQSIKTIKLNDTYEVLIRMNNSDTEGYSLYECSSVTLPTYKPKTETYQYGNNVKTFVYPDYQSVTNLELEMIEHYTDNDKLSVQNLVNACLHKLFDVEHFSYKLTDYIHEIRIKVYNNNFSHSVLEHVFNDLKLVDYKKYDLDYSSSEVAKWTLKFSFQSYYIATPDEIESTAETHVEEPVQEQHVEDEPTPQEHEPVQSTDYDRQEAYMAAQRARGDRGVDTMAENRSMAEAYLANTEKTPTKAADREQRNIQEINQERDIANTQLEQAKLQLAADEQEHQKRIAEHGKAVKSYYEYTDSTTRRQREEKGERFDSMKLAEENRKLSHEQVQRDKQNIQTLETQVAELNAKVKREQVAMAKKTSHNKAKFETVDTAKQQVERFTMPNMNGATGGDAAYMAAQRARLERESLNNPEV